MKKILFLGLGFVFLFSVEAVPCTAEVWCGEEYISCTANYSCTSGPDWVSCTSSGGGTQYNRCGLGG